MALIHAKYLVSLSGGCLWSGRADSDPDRGLEVDLYFCGTVYSKPDIDASSVGIDLKLTVEFELFTAVFCCNYIPQSNF